MTPVISPWVFYAMAVVDDFQSLLLGASVIIGLAIVAGLIGYSSSFGDSERTKYLAFLKKLIAPFVICGVVMSLVPSSTTITKMLIAQNVTYERVEVATDTIQSVYEDIMDLFEEEDDG